jgi:hypothetical protein
MGRANGLVQHVADLTSAIAATASRGSTGAHDAYVAEAQASRNCQPLTNAIVRASLIGDALVRRKRVS